MNEFVFDPKVFIRPPYITCPTCGAEEQFGVLMIGWGYTRRCRECWFTERYDLPEIRKKIIWPVRVGSRASAPPGDARPAVSGTPRCARPYRRRIAAKASTPSGRRNDGDD